MKFTSKTPKDLTIRDLTVYAQYDYDSGRSCENNAGSCDGYCHHGTISNVRVTKYDTENAVADLQTGSPIYNYCVERIFAIYNSELQDPSNWSISTERGYYGEEVGNIDNNDGTIYNILTNLQELEKTTDDGERILNVLTLEYGHVLPELASAEFRATKIDVAAVHIGQTEHMRKVYRPKVDEYRKRNFKEDQTPQCLVIRNSAGDYRLIDGYHRLAAAKAEKVVEIMAIVADT